MSYPTAKLLAATLLLLAGCVRRPVSIITPPDLSAPASTVPPAGARSAYIAGHRCLAQGAWEDAAEAFAEAHELDPSSPAILRGLAAASAGQGDSAAAADYLQQAAALEEEGP